MPREIDTHKVNGCNDGITLTAEDEPGSGGANHKYYATFGEGLTRQVILLPFQNGPIKEVGTNGITHEVLIAVLIDRLEGFQRGPFACQANNDALRHLLLAQDSLLSRTRERMSRGVEGTHTT